MTAGWLMSDSTPPKLSASATTSSFLRKPAVFALPPFKVKVTMPLKPDICRFANACCG
jgi:hypothetical protein